MNMLFCCHRSENIKNWNNSVQGIKLEGKRIVSPSSLLVGSQGHEEELVWAVFLPLSDLSLGFSWTQPSSWLQSPKSSYLGLEKPVFTLRIFLSMLSLKLLLLLWCTGKCQTSVMKKCELAFYLYKFLKPKFENGGRNDSLVSNWSMIEKYRGCSLCAFKRNYFMGLYFV